MSWLCLDGHEPPTSSGQRPPRRPAHSTQWASLPTWGQVKTLCHQAQEMASLQGSLSSPERVFIAILALLSCQRPPYLVVPVTTTHWYDNYGLAVLQQLWNLMCSKQFIRLLIIGISALITAITSVSVAAIALTQQIHTAQYVNTMSKNVSLASATQEVIEN